MQNCYNFCRCTGLRISTRRKRNGSLHNRPFSQEGTRRPAGFGVPPPPAASATASHTNCLQREGGARLCTPATDRRGRTKASTQPPVTHLAAEAIAADARRSAVCARSVAPGRAGEAAREGREQTAVYRHGLTPGDTGAAGELGTITSSGTRKGTHGPTA